MGDFPEWIYCKYYVFSCPKFHCCFITHVLCGITHDAIAVHVHVHVQYMYTHVWMCLSVKAYVIIKCIILKQKTEKNKRKVQV